MDTHEHTNTPKNKIIKKSIYIYNIYDIFVRNDLINLIYIMNKA